MADDFAAQVARFARLAATNTEKAVKGTSIALFRDVIQATPVDTGRARANWTAALAQPATGTTEKTDKTKNAGPTVAEMTAFINGSTNATEFTLANNLPYAAVLEFGGYPGDGPNTVGGYSKQAPAGMVRVNAARFEKILEAAAAQVRN